MTSCNSRLRDIDLNSLDLTRAADLAQLKGESIDDELIAYLQRTFKDLH